MRYHTGFSFASKSCRPVKKTFLTVCLIVEGCYIPFDWQKDFDSKYLECIKYYCLVMSEQYIRNHFADIKKYASVIENRLDDEWCTMESVLADNAEVLALTQKHNANFILIDDQYEIIIDLDC